MSALHPLSIIDRILSDLELTVTQYDDVKASYESVAAVLNQDDSPIHVWTPRIFPQGSMRLGTTVRPFGQNQFDLDMVCWLGACGKTYSAEDIFEWVWDTIGRHSTYRAMRRRKSRCIRLEYSGDYYLDIIPAIPDWIPQHNSLYVADREHKIWCSTHPIGFADWFKASSEIQPKIESKRPPERRLPPGGGSSDPRTLGVRAECALRFMLWRVDRLAAVLSPKPRAADL